MSMEAYQEWLFSDGAPLPLAAATAPPASSRVQPPKDAASIAETATDAPSSSQAREDTQATRSHGDDSQFMAGVADAVAAREVAGAQADQADTLPRQAGQDETVAVLQDEVEAAGIQLQRAELLSATVSSSAHRFGNVLREAVVDDSPLEFSDGPQPASRTAAIPQATAAPAVKEPPVAESAAARRSPMQLPPEPSSTEWKPPTPAAPVYYTLEGEATVTSAASQQPGAAPRRFRISSEVAFTAPPHAHHHWAAVPPSAPSAATTQRAPASPLTTAPPTDASASSSGIDHGAGALGATRHAAGRKFTDAEAERIARIMGLHR